MLTISTSQWVVEDHLVSEALYFTDPEGNGIEVYHDRPSEDCGETVLSKWIHWKLMSMI